MDITITLTPESEAILQWRTQSTGQTLAELVAECGQNGVIQAVEAVRGSYEAEQQAAKLRIVEAFDAADPKATKAEIIAAAEAPKAG